MRPEDLSLVTFPRRVIGMCIAAVALFLFVIGLGAEARAATHTLPSVGEVITLLGMALFFAFGAIPSKAGGKLHVLFGIFACLSVNLMLFKNYFDFTLPLNSPIRNALTLTEGAFLLHLLSEMRTLLGRNTVRFARFTSFVALSLTGGIAFGLLLALIFTPTTVPDGVSGARCVLCLLVAANAFLRCTEER